MQCKHFTVLSFIICEIFSLSFHLVYDLFHFNVRKYTSRVVKIFLCFEHHQNIVFFLGKGII